MRYIIREGKHLSAGLNFGLHARVQEMKKTVCFDTSCFYDLDDTQEQKHVNKLFGFSEGFQLQNSARFGWRCNPKTRSIQLHTYVYRDGVRANSTDDRRSFITEVAFRVPFEACIINQPKFYIFKVTMKGFTSAIAVEKSQENRVKWGYNLFPEFGWTMPAPYDMAIDIS